MFGNSGHGGEEDEDAESELEDTEPLEVIVYKIVS
jgi:hypothetical protein